MTRMINMDKLLQSFETDSPEKVRFSETMIRNIIELQPTVEAIPISYIQNQIERWERSKTESYHAICYRHLIEEWEIEQRSKE